MDIAGPAYRITVPAVIMVANLRSHKAGPETTKSGNNRWWLGVIAACGWAATTTTALFGGMSSRLWFLKILGWAATTALFGGKNRWWLWVIAAAAAGIVLMAALA